MYRQAQVFVFKKPSKDDRVQKSSTDIEASLSQGMLKRNNAAADETCWAMPNLYQNPKRKISQFVRF